MNQLTSDNNDIIFETLEKQIPTTLKEDKNIEKQRKGYMERNRNTSSILFSGGKDIAKL